MKVESYTVLHYGKPYLSWALASIYDVVDVLHVVYTEKPSHGHQTPLACPDSRVELMDVALGVGPKVQWHEWDRPYRGEGAHRDYALSLCKGDLALVVDADEIWEPHVLDGALRFAQDGKQRDTLVTMVTPWRSFGWVCHDEMQPVRIINKQGTGTAGYSGGLVWHFGYAIPDAYMRYKISCHGHKGEWRPNWYDEKWSIWPPVQDVHPTCEGFWNPEPLEPSTLPPVMRWHPYWDLEMIE